jgi:hypothetical protein
MDKVRIINVYGEEATAECKATPSKSYKWACIYVNPGTGMVGGARYFKTKKAADGLRRVSRTPAIVGDVWNL